MFGFRVVLEIPVRAQPNTSAAETKSLPPSLQEGLVAYYPFNGDAKDESGNGNHGTVYGTVLCRDRFGRKNGAYRFNGVDNYIRVEDTELLRLSKGEYTINLWAKIADEKGVAALCIGGGEATAVAVQKVD